MSKPIVAIVGRPNVGKSMLFNKLIGQRLSIVEDTPGVTRDRIYGDCEWCGRNFMLVDTGGIEPGTDNDMLKFMRRQAEIAIETATVIVMVVDVTVGLTAADAEVASMLKRSKKPVVLAVNKCDQTGHANPDVYEFYALGLGDPIEVSAVHGHGTGDLLDACVASFPPDDGEEYDEDVIKVAIIGKPNVGKSSLLNRVCPALQLPVGEVSEKLGRGRHTTRHIELYALAPDTFVADTPGFSAFDTERMELVHKEQLQYAFPEFGPYLGHCQFPDCAHRKEPGCAVRKALAEGKIGQTRYDSYERLYEMASQIKEWELK